MGSRFRQLAAYPVVRYGLCRLSSFGTFLPDLLDVPWPVVEYLAAQLGVTDVSVAKRYTKRVPIQHEDAREIRQAYGCRICRTRALPLGCGNSWGPGLDARGRPLPVVRAGDGMASAQPGADAGGDRLSPLSHIAGSLPDTADVR